MYKFPNTDDDRSYDSSIATAQVVGSQLIVHEDDAVRQDPNIVDLALAPLTSSEVQKF